MTTYHFDNENQMQNHIVIWFSQEYPKLYGSLFEVNNNPRNIREAMHRRGMGMVAGVSDLILIANGNFAGIELKHPKTKHSKDHIEQQKRWGYHLESQGGRYIMSDNVEEIKKFIKKIVG
jgi:hypothetical protein